MIPALGTVAYALNTAVYLAQGDLANAAMSAISLIPLGGAVAAAGALFAKYGDEIVQAAVKHGDELAEAAYKNGEKAVDLFTDVSKKTDNADEIADLCKNGACFVAGTLILTSEGYKKIEDIEEGDVVIATDPDTGETTEKKVVETFVNESDQLIYLTVNGEEIITTPTHPFYVPEKGWTDAEDLRAGDMLVLVNGEYVVIERTQHEFLEEPITVYNFEVEDFHTYYVGEQSLLVHNLCVQEGSLGVGNNTLNNGIPNNPQTTRRFMSKQEYKQFKKNGFVFDPNDSRGGISSTSTKIRPENPDMIKRSTGAMGADYYVDIDVSNKNVFFKGMTKGGVPDWKIQDNVDVSDIINSGRVKK